MKGFVRENQLLSLCGLNCGLCPMFLGKYCGGCGNGNQSCSIARCPLASAVLHRIATEQGVELKLRKPKAKTKGDNHD